ncbi:hypothetical protein QWJ39_14120 [Arthrobacter sp. YD4]|uniref:hypothetical protein n=1 Tax=Arthrobacter sp. YD4 TaxID=3058043 RepID=UPI0025B3B222|nr:hypothetical protein [Arthrobacter sp. YD4]MDN3937442.1 hypothetical protein [Arthrobacter sp. YD4]
MRPRPGSTGPPSACAWPARSASSPPCTRLGWEGAGRGSTGYHRWDLQRTDDGGTLIVTEEVQGGVLATLLGPVVRRSIEKQHQHWLEALVETAAARVARS